MKLRRSETDILFISIFLNIYIYIYNGINLEKMLLV